MSATVFTDPPTFTVSVTDVFLLTFEVVTVAVTEPLPAGTVALAGTETTDELLDRAKVTPPTGAYASKTIVIVLEAPPFTVWGSKLRSRSRVA